MPFKTALCSPVLRPGLSWTHSNVVRHAMQTDLALIFLAEVAANANYLKCNHAESMSARHDRKRRSREPTEGPATDARGSKSPSQGSRCSQKVMHRRFAGTRPSARPVRTLVAFPVRTPLGPSQWKLRLSGTLKGRRGTEVILGNV